MYVPEFNCLIRRMVSLSSKEELDKIRLPVLLHQRHGPAFRTLFHIHGRKSPTASIVQGSPGHFSWGCSFGHRTGRVALLRSIRGWRLKVYDLFGPAEISDYWEVDNDQS